MKKEKLIPNKDEDKWLKDIYDIVTLKEPKPKDGMICYYRDPMETTKLIVNYFKSLLPNEKESYYKTKEKG
jgi:hypothetical protein